MAHHKNGMAEQKKIVCGLAFGSLSGVWGMLPERMCREMSGVGLLSCFMISLYLKMFSGGKANGIRAKTGVTDCQKGGKSRQGVFFKGDTHLSCPISHVRPVLELARRLAVFLLETLGKILRVVEAYGIGHFGHGHVGLP